LKLEINTNMKMRIVVDVPCKECGKMKVKHNSKGLCVKCYKKLKQREYYSMSMKRSLRQILQKNSPKIIQ